MLLGIVFTLTAALGLGVCFAAGAFETLMWLWLLPVSLLGGFVLSLAAAFGFLALVCAFVDPDKPREKESRFFRTLAEWYVAGVIPLAGLKVHTMGLEKIPKEGRFLLVCNHLHEIDPAILLHYFAGKQVAFISKQENHDMFLVGKVMPMLLCPLINRENDRQALKTILRCISLLKEDKVSVGVFPEGYIHKEKRKLQHFRPGVFKIAQKANVPIVVCTLRDTHKVLGRLLKGKRSQIHLHLLDVIPAEHVKALSTVELAQEVYEMMAKDLGPENVLTEEEENT